MNARFYYQVRIAMFVVIFLMVPVMLVWNRTKADSTVIIGLTVFDLIIAGLLFHAVRKYRSLEPDATINYGPPPEVVQAQAAAGSRQMPLAAFAIGTVSLVGSWFYMMYEHRGYPAIILIAPSLLLLGLAGTIHPPIFYAMRNDVGEVDGGHRAIAYFLMIVGLGLGGFCAWWFFWR